MRVLIITIISLLFLIFSSLNGAISYRPSEVSAATCSFSFTPTQVNQGESVSVTINNPTAGKTYIIRIGERSPNLTILTEREATSTTGGSINTSLTIPANAQPDVYDIWVKDKAGTFGECSPETSSQISIGGALGACSFTISPTSIQAGDQFTVSIANAMNNFSHGVTVKDQNGNQAAFERVTTQNNQATVSINSGTDWNGSYTVTVVNEFTSSNCNPTIGLTLNVQGTSSPSPGQNPCDPDGDGIADQCPTALGDIPTDPGAFAGKILSIAIGLAGGIALILMVIGSVRVLTSSGDQQRLAGGRDMIVAAVAGLLFLIFSFLILEFIGGRILELGFGGFSAP